MARLPVLLLLLLIFPVPQGIAGEFWLVDLKGPVGPASADHIVRNINAAQDAGAAGLILRMDTPGGLDSAMRDIIHAILESRIPVLGYVAPQGSRAASAGTYILYASHIAAMAPATNLGAATPVQIGGLPSMPGQEDKSGDGDSQQSDGNGDSAPQLGGDAMSHKAINDARAYIRGLAELRGRNAEWAELAVTEAATLTASQALDKGVIDLVAADVDQLLAQVSGRTVTIGQQPVTIDTGGATVRPVEADWRTRFLAVITNPNVAYILMMLGIYGLFLEFSNPGIGIGGVVGGICLLLALYALQLLPISYSALGLLLLGLGLMIAEALSPSFGVLGLGGLIAFIVGSIMLMDTEVPGFQIALPLILSLAVVSAGLLILVLAMLMKSRQRAVVSGIDTLVGEGGEIVDIRHGQAMVRIHGELWRARGNGPLALGDRVRVTATDGLDLDVIKEN